MVEVLTSECTMSSLFWIFTPFCKAYDLCEGKRRGNWALSERRRWIGVREAKRWYSGLGFENLRAGMLGFQFGMDIKSYLYGYGSLFSYLYGYGQDCEWLNLCMVHSLPLGVRSEM